MSDSQHGPALQLGPILKTQILKMVCLFPQFGPIWMKVSPNRPISEFLPQLDPMFLLRCSIVRPTFKEITSDGRSMIQTLGNFSHFRAIIERTSKFDYGGLLLS